MTVFDWPTALRAATLEWRLRKAGVQFSSPYNGNTQALDFNADRWECSLTLPGRQWREAGAVEAFFMRLAGGVHRVRVPHFGRRNGEPLGTLRGTPVLNALAGRGSTALHIGGNLGSSNVLPWSGLQADADPVDGLCDSLGVYQDNSPPGLYYQVGFDDDLQRRYQRTVTSSLAGSPAQRAGAYGGAALAGAGLRTFSLYMRATPGLAVAIAIQVWSADPALDAFATLLAYGSDSTIAGGSFAYQRLAVTVTAPSGTGYIRVFWWMEGALGTTCLCDASRPQLDVGVASPLPFVGPVTLKAGDMLGASGQLFMAAEDATATDAGVITVPIVNPVRAELPSGAAVTWASPTCTMMMPAPGWGVTHVPGLLDVVAIDLIEAP